MHVTMVKKRLKSGELCAKCRQAEELLRRRGLFDRIDRVVVAEEADPNSEGMRLAAEHGLSIAPFFLVQHAQAGDAVAAGAPGPAVYASVLGLIQEVLAPAAARAPAEPVAPPSSEGPPPAAALGELESLVAGKSPADVLGVVLERFGARAGIAFSGAEDVVLIDMAVKSGRPFSVFCLDTGRLHAETYRFLDRVRRHYGITIDVVFPNFVEVEALVREKGLFSFYEDGHHECCRIRKVDPLRRKLAEFDAWLTGQRADQSPATRAGLPLLELDAHFRGREGQPLVKCNPLAGWTLGDVWRYLRDADAPSNELHTRGFVSIGCEPCTRAPRPAEHERAGRWWWEQATERECGLHTGGAPR